MAIKVDTTVVVDQFTRVANKIKECNRLVKQINTFYVEGMYSEWNTKAAADYIDGLCNAINDFSSQFNTKIQAGIDDFSAGVRQILTVEKITLAMQIGAITPIGSIKRDWNPQETQFNLPEDFEKFTKDKFKPAIDSLCQNLDEMKAYVNTAVQRGLEDKFCTRLRNSLTELLNSAKTVAEEYSSDAASSAANKDKTTLSLKNNT